MRTIDKLLSRFGYVKLDTFGLALASDGRVRSTHRDLHVDGSGDPVVGWLDDDVAVADLPAWRSPPSLPAPADQTSQEDEWEMLVTRARIRIDAVSDLGDEAPTVHDAQLPRPEITAHVIVSPPRRRLPPPPPPRRLAAASHSIPHVPRAFAK